MLVYNGNVAVAALNPFHHTLKVMTFNIRGGRDDYHRLDLGDILAEIRNQSPDIIGMQEVDVRLPRSHFRNEIEEIGKALNYNYVFAPNLNLLVGSYGDAILSKYPIASYAHFQLPSIGEPRGALLASIRYNGKTIHVYTTHLGLSQEERSNQFSVLSSIITSDKYPKIVLGDFNTKPKEGQIETFKEQIGEQSNSKQKKLITLRPEHTQIDYIFQSKEFMNIYSDVEQSKVSDHNPLISGLVFSLKPTIY